MKSAEDRRVLAEATCMTRLSTGVAADTVASNSSSGFSTSPLYALSAACWSDFAFLLLLAPGEGRRAAVPADAHAIRHKRLLSSRKWHRQLWHVWLAV
jgi:hypothetical protein